MLKGAERTALSPIGVAHMIYKNYQRHIFRMGASFPDLFGVVARNLIIERCARRETIIGTAFQPEYLNDRRLTTYATSVIRSIIRNAHTHIRDGMYKELNNV